jgi:Ca2+-binding RTX toxin-like protein
MAFPADNFGTNGNDNVETNSFFFLYGLDGADKILDTDKSNTDTLYGGRGNDFLLDGIIDSFSGSGTLADPYSNIVLDATDSGASVLSGDEGRDILLGGGGADTLYGGEDDDSGVVIDYNGSFIYAGLYGGDGADYLDGGRGNDDMYGGAGADTIIANSGVDRAFGGDGTDNIYGGRYTVVTDRMTAEGGNGNDYIFAGDNIDVLYGDNAAGTETGNDFIWAGGGNDYLIGGNGTDTLIGNTGSDFFYGGAGLDWFDLAYDVNGGDADYLLDFQAGTDYVLMHKSNQNDVTFGVSGGYAYGFISEGSGSYLFLAAGLTAAQLQASTLFVI